MQRSESLGTRHSVELPSGRIGYFEDGTGAPVVFIHGLLVNAELWRNVVPGVAGAGYRCLALDLPLGSHEIPMPGAADLSPPGVARLIAEFLAELDLTDVTLVANDTGGALTQLVMTSHPERIGRVVLTPSDCFEAFFPPAFSKLPRNARVPGYIELMATALQSRLVRRLPMTYGSTVARPIPDEILRRFTRPARRAAIRRDVRRFVISVHNRYTLAAAQRFAEFTQPVLLAWAKHDRILPIRLGRRLAEALPNARLVELEDCRTFLPEDQPERLAELIIEFTREQARGEAARSA